MRLLVVGMLFVIACNDIGANPPEPPRQMETRWAITLGTRNAQSPVSDTAFDVAFTSNGDVVAAGQLGDDSIITLRAGHDGSELWTSHLGLAWIANVGVGVNDDLVVAGTVVGQVDVAGTTVGRDGERTPFVAMFDRTGALRWVRSLVTLDGGSVMAMRVDRSGQIFLAGTTSMAGDEVFLSTYLPSSEHHGTARFEVEAVSSLDLAIAENGDVVMTGGFVGRPDFGLNTIETNGARQRSFLARFSRTAAPIFVRAIGPGSPYASFLQQVVTLGDRIAVQAIEHDERGGGVAEEPHAVVRFFDENGVEEWSVAIAPTGQISPPQRPIAARGDSILSASWVDDVFTGEGAMDVATFASTGAPGALTFGTRVIMAPTPSSVIATSVDTYGAIAFLGTFAGAIDFGTGATTSTHELPEDFYSDSDIFLAVTEP